MTPSHRQAPVVDVLRKLLEMSAARAAALIDNAHADGFPLDTTAVTQLRQQLRAIDLLIVQSSATPTP